MKENTREISVIKQRILKFLAHKGISKYECYKITGITNGVFSQTNGLSEENLLKFLAHNRDISLNWLLYGEGGMIQEECHVKNHSIGEESFLYKMYKDVDVKADRLLKENALLEKENNELKDKIRALEGAGSLGTGKPVQQPVSTNSKPGKESVASSTITARYGKRARK